MADLQDRIQQINKLSEKNSKALLKVIYSQLEINKKDENAFKPSIFAADIRNLLDEYSEEKNEY